MLHSKYAHKETYEDPKTSSVFENLMLLPDNVFWHIIRHSCFYNQKIEKNCGLLLSYQFWPKWSAKGNDIKNTYIVEPDLFIRFEHFDVIIEAKFSDNNGQNIEQWKQELTAYHNEFEKEKRTVIFIAVGGNQTIDTETIKVRNTNHIIYKCNWLSLLIEINKYKAQLQRIAIPDMNISATLRLLDNIILAFNINGVYNLDWFNSMATNKSTISITSINLLNKHFIL